MSHVEETPAIVCRGLVKSYPGHEVLRGIDFEIPRGTVFGYIGPNGAGKTTTVRILAGIDDDYEGEVYVAGLNVGLVPREVKARIGLVPESAHLYEGLTIYEHLQLIGRLHAMDEAAIETRAFDLLEIFELQSRAHNRLATCSKGMKQKVMFCSALLPDPEVLFLDEPLSGLDVESTIFVKGLIRAWADSGRTVMYCSHMMDVVERVCDRIVILDDGGIVADGSFAELAARSDEASLEGLFREVTGSESPEGRIEALLGLFEGKCDRD